MALAILALVAADTDGLRFTADTGTNRYYRLRVGTGVRQAGGIDWADGVYATTPIRANERSGELGDTSLEVALPGSALRPGEAYVQLVSFKTPGGKSPAFSRVVRGPRGPPLLP